MNRHRWVIGGTLSWLVWIWLGVGHVHADTIPPTDPTTRMLVANPTVTLSLYQLDSDLPAAITTSSPSRCVRLGLAAGQYRDVTDCWLPEVGKPVYVVVNGSIQTPTLVAPAAATFPLAAGAPNPFVTSLTTSAYPGECGNTGSGTGADFLPSVLTPTILPTSATTAVTGYQLIPQDCGGMAVIQVGTQKFIVPKDGTATVAANGIPELWENLYGGNLTASDDTDHDGISNLDEYRGHRVSGKQVRLNPVQKDAFLYLVTANNLPAGTCSGTSLLLSTPYPALTLPSATLTPPATAGTVGAIGTFTASAAVFSNANTLGEIVGTAAGRARILVVTSSTVVTAQVTQSFPSASPISSGSWKLSESLFANLYGLFSAERVRVLAGGLNSAEWVDNFATYSESTGKITYTAGTDGATSDRVVNVNRIYGPAQKGVRAIECLDTSVSSIYGYTLGGVGTPNTRGNILLYTQRIVNNIGAPAITGVPATATTSGLIASNAPRSVQYSPMTTFDSRANDWSPKSLVLDGNPGSAAVRNFVISKAMQFYFGMEGGHTFQLNTLASNNPHFATFSGDGLDAAVSAKPDRSTSGFNTFYIPSMYGVNDVSQALVQ